MSDAQKVAAMRVLVENLAHEPLHQIMTQQEVAGMTIPFISRARKILGEAEDGNDWEGEHSD
jgi:hypothetical protein